VSARRELYVYYRVQLQQWRAAAEAAMAWQRELCRAHAGLRGRVLWRPDAPDDAVTLMETYSGADISDAALEAMMAQGAPTLPRWLIGERHVERFEALE
jgi:Domain of unknown function (DUF4936)